MDIFGIAQNNAKSYFRTNCNRVTKNDVLRLLQKDDIYETLETQVSTFSDTVIDINKISKTVLTSSKTAMCIAAYKCITSTAMDS